MGWMKKGNKKITKKSGVITKSNFKAVLKKALGDNSVAELKRFRVDSGNTVSSTASLVAIISGMTQGITDLNSRVGDKITLRSLRMRGNLVIGDTTNIMRLVLFLWNEDSSVCAPSAASILDDTTSASTQLYCDFNKDGDNVKNKKFHVLYDKRFTLSASRNIINVDVHKEFKTGYQCGFIAGAGTGIGMPYLLICSDSVAITHPAYYLNFALTYSDL